ncbi:arginase family protein [Spirochaeta isovalerica]|uniref:Agmatinase n=1 Tax=Spirochaeta isovalerica TaxID=150 RepID=A0A841RAE3_9SPIO|nr:arginase family protein [Spirochaeta isovalerica]MBB6480696.1 agmatinase [Spirochaeta isovalerica]
MKRNIDLQIAGAENISFEESAIAVWGLPTSAGGGTGRLGAEKGPEQIRIASHTWNTLRTSAGYQFDHSGKICDLGDIPLDGLSGAELIAEIAGKCPADSWDRFLLTLGGDHSITYPLIKAIVSKCGRPPGLIYFDAHPDTVDQVDGNPYSHAAVLRRLVDENLIDQERTLLIGIRVPEAEEVDYIQDKKLKVISPDDILEKGIGFVRSEMEKLIDGNPLYMSLDLDVMNGCEVPGVENPEPGGLSSRELLYLVNRIAPHLSSCDIVELSGETDPAGITAKTAARLAIDIMGGVLNQSSKGK